MTKRCLKHEDELSMCVSVYGLGVRTLSVAELNERLAETDTNIQRFSEELVQQLALRDELEFEKEVKNTFISLLIDVQNRQKEHRELLRKKKKIKGGAGTSQAHTERTFGSVSTKLKTNVSSLCTFLFGDEIFKSLFSTVFSPTICVCLKPLLLFDELYSCAPSRCSSALQHGGNLVCHSEQLPAHLWERVQWKAGYLSLSCWALSFCF